MKKSFKEQLEELNSAQRKAVDEIDGPVMVVAGPGTGKTQILAARIANILEKTDTQAYQILCLTYTDAGVVAMRERLERFIGPLAYRVHIHTFHSLCNEIIQFNGSYFGYNNLKAASDLDVIEILQEMIDELPIDHVLKRLKNDVYYDVWNFKSLFEIIKKENLSVDEIKIKAAHFLKEKEDNGEFLYQRKTGEFNKGDFNIKKYNEAKLSVDKLTAAVELYEVYIRKMIERKLYDFNDMILWVLNAFKTDKNFLLNYQERFLYFLVDEFQDTNGAQLQLVDYLAEYWDIPNLFIVGDEDQSIFRFQGANIDNIKKFEEQYKRDLKITQLTQNYRSSQLILNASRSLMNLNGEVKEPLVASHSKVAELNEKPHLISYFNPLHEAIGIGNKIKTLHAQGVSYSEIAVLYNKHKQVEDLMNFFNANGIPYSTKRKINVLNELLVKKLLIILEYIDLESNKPFSGDHLLFQILNFDFYQIKAIDIAKLSTEIKYKKWREYLNDHFNQQKDLFSSISSNDSISELKRVISDLEYWIKEAINSTVPQLLEKIIAKGGVLSYVMQANDKRWQMQVLRTFFEFVKEESSKNPNLSLRQLLNLVERYNEFGISIEAMKIMQVSDSVNLMTLHGSKGLEFEHVFIIRCVENEWLKTKSDNVFSFNKIYLNQDNQNADIDELRRLFYVGMTRAKKSLTLSFFRQDLKEKEVTKLQFISELIEQTNLEIKEESVEESLVIEFESQFYFNNHIKDFELIDHQYIDELLANYTLSATHLNTYLKCPVTFYFNHVIKVPSAKSPSASFGTAIHSALELFFKSMQNNDEKQLPTLDELLQHYEKSLFLNKDCFTDKEYKRYLANGLLILPKYYNRYKDEWQKNTIFNLEKNFHHIEYKGIPIKGKLDRINFNGRQAHVIDFKTGKWEEGKKKCVGPVAIKDTDEYTQGGDYWRQMVFYHLLIEYDSKREWTMNTGEMDFVEPNKHDEFYKHQFTITPNDVEIVANQIKNTYKSIKNHEFEKGCGEEYCQWCNFVKYYLKKEIFISEFIEKSENEELNQA